MSLALEIQPVIDQKYCNQLTEVAHQAKRHWGYPEAWIEAWREDLTFTPEMLAEQQVFAAFDDQKIVGCIAVGQDDGDWHITHLWVLPEAMGHGLGRQLFDRALATARKRGIDELKIISDPSAEPFYRHLGAQPFSEFHSQILGEPRVLPILCVEVG